MLAFSYQAPPLASAHLIFLDIALFGKLVCICVYVYMCACVCVCVSLSQTSLVIFLIASLVIFLIAIFSTKIIAHHSFNFQPI